MLLLALFEGDVGLAVDCCEIEPPELFAAALENVVVDDDGPAALLSPATTFNRLFSIF